MCLNELASIDTAQGSNQFSRANGNCSDWRRALLCFTDIVGAVTAL